MGIAVVQEIERASPDNVRGRLWSVWQLADDREAYGENAGRFIIVTDDGEEEIDAAGIYSEQDAAQAIVDQHNANVSLGPDTITVNDTQFYQYLTLDAKYWSERRPMALPLADLV